MGGNNINVTSEWWNAAEVESLEIDDYFNALSNGIAESIEEELFIRIRIWWAYNDKIREEEENEIFNDPIYELRWEENVKQLRTILPQLIFYYKERAKIEENYDQSYISYKFTLAEIFRNLGDFENCISIIISFDDDDLSLLKKHFLINNDYLCCMKEQILNECKRKNRWVIKLD